MYHHDFIKKHEEGFFNAIPEEKRIVYKHSDYNNFALLTKNADGVSLSIRPI
jgi:hypothetical protein